MKNVTLILVFAGIVAGELFAQMPQLVKDVNAATADADPVLTTNVNGTLFFFVSRMSARCIHSGNRMVLPMARYRLRAMRHSTTRIRH